MIEEIIQIVRESFGLTEEDVVNMDSSAETIDEWDSFGQIVLLQNLEQHYQMNFSFDEIIQMENVKGICGVIQERRGK